MQKCPTLRQHGSATRDTTSSTGPQVLKTPQCRSNLTGREIKFWQCYFDCVGTLLELWLDAHHYQKKLQKTRNSSRGFLFMRHFDAFTTGKETEIGRSIELFLGRLLFADWRSLKKWTPFSTAFNSVSGRSFEKISTRLSSIWEKLMDMWRRQVFEPIQQGTLKWQILTIYEIF